MRLLGRCGNLASHCLWLGWVVVGAAGCLSHTDTRVTQYDIYAHLVPEEHHLIGRVTLHLQRIRQSSLSGTLAFDFTLNRALTVKSLHSPEATVVEHTTRPLEPELTGQAPKQSLHHVVLDGAPETLSLVVEYFGTLVQDVSAGEQPGQIHNFTMAAHIGEDGVYLEPSGGWYPMPRRPADEPPPLADYRVTAAKLSDIVLAVSATLDVSAVSESDELTWNTPRPTDGVVLVGGKHRVKVSHSGPIRLALHHAAGADPEAQSARNQNADLFLAAAADYLKRYQPLIGPYPFEQFTIVENFFSSGFAFPQMTLLSSALLDMGPKALKHGYLDHELLHNWWGNGVYVDPTDGNWCEALASYGANYYGYILDDEPEGARQQRRDCCNSLSRIKPEDDKPLGTFGRPQGAGRGIGYSKGTMVFHMLARKIGQERFWAALRELTAEHLGRYANWKTLQTLFEKHGGQDLERFFSQWVRGSGAPALHLERARWNVDTRILEVDVSQQEPPFDLDLPLRLEYGSQTLDQRVRIDQTMNRLRLPLEQAPQAVLLDPDYEVFRKLQPSEVMPTAAITSAAGGDLVVLVPSGELAEGYRRVIGRFGGADTTPRELVAGELEASQLVGRSLLVLGAAAMDPAVQALLERTRCPVTWQDQAFAVDGQVFDEPGNAVVCTDHHPDQPGAGITWYYGNSDTALGRSDLLLFYGNSLLVFATERRPGAGEAEYSSEVILRKDFESVERLEVTQSESRG